MFHFQQTGAYRQIISALGQILKDFPEDGNPLLKRKIEEEAYNITDNLAKGLSNLEKSDKNEQMQKSIDGIAGIIALTDLAGQNESKINPVKRELVDKLRVLQSDLQNFKSRQKKILILSAHMGQGHMTAAKAVSEALRHNYGYDYSVEIVDFMELLNSLVNLVTKTYYENSVKFVPSMYKIVYDSSNKNVKIVKLLNQVNYPFVLSKIKKFFDEKQPDLLISTFPFWNYLASEIWKKHTRDAKFISIITDSITVHNSWVLADTDYHIVANEDTRQSLLDMGTPPEKIKTLGFPVKLDFLEETARGEFLKKLNLNPKLQTILFLPTSQGQKKNQKIVKDILAAGGAAGDRINLIIITGRDSKNKPKLEKIAAGCNNVKVIGWTDQMPDFIKTADIVVTKAGGATVMECIAAGKPMVITSIIPGQEEGNAELIRRYRLGIISSDKDNIADHIDYIRKNYKSFQRSINKLSNPKSALQIADFINDLLQN
ncbi:glycosyltransferase [Patescibacteria group bacterium]|nr:glycosyltransferase [Patescibacteria group bacterium]MBU1703190.1 glycosyltransferase [Patescibacteria group bacterium]MBU1953526.1 glycosyltransferase [Patescibacteria group bacterium]